MAMHNLEPGWVTSVEHPGYGVNASVAIAEVMAKRLAAIHITGGRARKYCRPNRHVLDAIRVFDERGKCLIAICRGTRVFNSANVVRDGRKVAA